MILCKVTDNCFEMKILKVPCCFLFFLLIIKCCSELEEDDVDNIAVMTPDRSEHKFMVNTGAWIDPQGRMITGKQTHSFHGRI